MKLETSRLLIRTITPADLPDVHRLHSLPQTDAFNTLGIPQTVAVTEAVMAGWLQAQATNTAYVFCIELLAESSPFIGLIALNLGEPKYSSAEVWYKLLPGYWGQGYASEALRAVLAFGFGGLKLHRIEAGCAVDNGASARVLEKAGMTREGRKRKKLPIRGEWVDNYFYAMLEEDFEAMSSTEIG
jgi:ribosomal-protein-alanine N-acetyltransferase